MKPLIIVAEDDAEILMVLLEVLDSEGYRVHTASDGQAAWDYLASCIHCPSLLITDIMMPRMTGLDLVAKLRASDKYKSLPIVVYSASPQFKSIIESQSCDFLLKPFDIDQVLSVVKKYTKEV